MSTRWRASGTIRPYRLRCVRSPYNFGDITPYLYRTADYGKTWTRIAGPSQGVRGYVHVIREDRLNPNILFMGTEFGLWISLDAGHAWAQFKGGDMPDVAVRDLVEQPQEDDLVLACHGRNTSGSSTTSRRCAR